jgi:Glycosyl transferase family 2
VESGSICHAELLVSRALSRWPPGDLVEELGAVIRDFYLVPPPTLEEIAEESEDVGERRAALLDQLKERSRGSDHITGGAKDLIDESEELLSAYRHLLADKIARQKLRGDFGVGIATVTEAAPRPIVSRPPPDSGFDPDGALRVEPAAEVPSGGVFVEPEDSEGTIGGEPPRDWSRVSIPQLCRSRGVDFSAVFESPRAIEFNDRGAIHAIPLGELPEALADESRSEEVVAVFRALLKSSDRFTVLLVWAAVMSGRLKIAPAILGHLRVFAIRALMGANAYESAYQEALALAGSGNGVELLPEGEQRRLERLIARSAARTGRVQVAVDRYTEIFAREPDDDDVFRELLGTVFNSDEKLTRSLCNAALHAEMDLRPNDWLFIAELLRGMDMAEEAFGIVHWLNRQNRSTADGFLALANIGLSQGNEIIWRSALERYFEAHNLPLTWQGEPSMRPFGFRAEPTEPIEDHPLVSIVMTTYNAAATVEKAVASIQAQNCANWELIVVDDLSTDGTREIVERLAGEDPRIEHVFRSENGGTYVAKNEGIGIARGSFITFHDSDDWMHPRRIEGHLRAMSGGIRCTTSMWLRMEEAGFAVVRRGGPFTHLNPASTFYRRSVFDSVGLFDPVRTGADAELLARVRVRFGPNSVRAIHSPLGIGLHHPNSLTQSGATAFDEFRYSPVRLAYTESWLRWHLLEVAGGRELRIDQERCFDVPEAIRP